MKIDELVQELERAARSGKVRVSYENIGGELGAGGLCRVKGDWRIIIDKRAPPGERATVLAAGLARLPTDLWTDIEESLASEGKPLHREAVALVERSRPRSGPRPAA